MPTKGELKVGRARPVEVEFEKSRQEEKEQSNSNNNNNIDNDERASRIETNNGFSREESRREKARAWPVRCLAAALRGGSIILPVFAQKDEGRCIVFNRHRWQADRAK